MLHSSGLQETCIVTVSILLYVAYGVRGGHYVFQMSAAHVIISIKEYMPYILVLVIGARTKIRRLFLCAPERYLSFSSKQTCILLTYHFSLLFELSNNFLSVIKYKSFPV